MNVIAIAIVILSNSFAMRASSGSCFHTCIVAPFFSRFAVCVSHVCLSFACILLPCMVHVLKFVRMPLVAHVVCEVADMFVGSVFIQYFCVLSRFRLLFFEHSFSLICRIVL